MKKINWSNLSLAQKLNTLRVIAIAFGWRVMITTPDYFTSKPAWSIGLVPVGEKRDPITFAAIRATQGDDQSFEDVVDAAYGAIQSRMKLIDDAVEKIVEGAEDG